jgi:hypothetical protein
MPFGTRRFNPDKCVLLTTRIDAHITIYLFLKGWQDVCEMLNLKNPTNFIDGIPFIFSFSLFYR